MAWPGAPSGSSLAAPLAAQSPAPDSANKVQLSGYVTASYFYATEPDGRRITGRLYDRFHDEFEVNAARLTIQKPVAIDRRDAGFQVDLLYGQNASQIRSAGLSLGDDGDIPQAFVTLNVPTGQDRYVRFAAGKRWTMMDVEYVDDILNPNYSHGYPYIYVSNFTDVGLSVEAKVFGVVEADVRLINGWDVVEDNNKAKSVMARLGITPSDKVALSFLAGAGPEQADNTHDNRYVGQFVGTFKPAQKTTFYTEFDAGSEEGLGRGWWKRFMVERRRVGRLRSLARGVARAARRLSRRHGRGAHLGRVRIPRCRLATVAEPDSDIQCEVVGACAGPAGGPLRAFEPGRLRRWSEGQPADAWSRDVVHLLTDGCRLAGAQRRAQKGHRPGTDGVSPYHGRIRTRRSGSAGATAPEGASPGAAEVAGESQIGTTGFFEIVRRRERGKLKVYIGSAAGTGKSYRMLQEAHELRRRGVDVVVGFIESHGRSETEAQIGSIEVVARKQIPYRGVMLEEMDLDAVIARRPEVAIVDELAHSNVPGTKHRKRWEDVLDLLDEGINVISAVNVQHLESLNDVISRTLGVTVRETVPDWVIMQADQVVNLDISAQDLQQRLREGKIYKPEKIATALSNFFTHENLTTLRELALREVAKFGGPGARGDRAPRGRNRDAPDGRSYPGRDVQQSDVHGRAAPQGEPGGGAAQLGLVLRLRPDAGGDVRRASTRPSSGSWWTTSSWRRRWARRW